MALIVPRLTRRLPRPENDPPDQYRVTFRGKGIHRSTSQQRHIETIDLHECEIKLPYSYPRRPPDIRWRTPITHPNISFSGLIKLRDVGLPWDDQLGLDVVCERLWDVARMSYIDADKACNYAAKNWLVDQSSITLPTDERPLRDKTAPAGSNVIRYERRADGFTLPSTPSSTDDVFYIDEDTPTPELPQPQPRQRPLSHTGDEDVFFIGDD